MVWDLILMVDPTLNSWWCRATTTIIRVSNLCNILKVDPCDYLLTQGVNQPLCFKLFLFQMINRSFKGPMEM
jgi:hypothetical protein